MLKRTHVWTVAVVGALCAHAWLYWPYFADDALISLRYAHNLSAGDGLVWNPGSEAVEGFSNPLFVLMEALFMSLGVDGISAARWLSFSGVLACVALLLGGSKENGQDSPWSGLFAAGLFVSSPSSAIWALGGLEISWMAACALIAARSARWGPWALGLAAALRSDGLVMALGAAAAVAASPTAEGHRWRKGLRWLAPALFITTLWIGARRLYFHDWLPNTAYVKVDLDAAGLQRGASYVLWAAASCFAALPWWLRGLSAQPLSRSPAVAYGIGFAWTAHLIVAGGDYLPGLRLWLPVWALLCEQTRAGTTFLFEGKRWRLPLVVGACALAALQWVVQSRRPDTLFATSQPELETCRRAGQSLRQLSTGEAPLLAVNMAGCLPWYSQLEALDMGGLNDRHIARRRAPPRDFPHSAHGRGDGSYVLERAPDLVQFCGPLGAATPCFSSGESMLADRRFGQRYRLAHLDVGASRPGRYWVRIDSAAFGLRRSDDGWRVSSLLWTNARRVARVCGAKACLDIPAQARWSVKLSGLPDDVIATHQPQIDGLELRVHRQDELTTVELANQSSETFALGEVWLRRPVPSRRGHIGGTSPPAAHAP